MGTALDPKAPSPSRRDTKERPRFPEAATLPKRETRRLFGASSTRRAAHLKRDVNTLATRPLRQS
jgi:hypothetical protein